MNLESGHLLWIRVLESTDRRAIRRYWVNCLLQSEIDQVIGELRLASRAVTHGDVGRRVLRRSGPYSFARGSLDYVAAHARSRGDSGDRHRLHQPPAPGGDPCMGIRLEKRNHRHRRLDRELNAPTRAEGGDGHKGNERI